jgi:hypothetical protein
MNLLLGNGLVLYTPWHNKELALFQDNVLLSKLKDQLAFYHQKQLILSLMVVPDEFAFQFRELDMLSIEFPYDFRRPKRPNFSARLTFSMVPSLPE